ncbi:pantoate--beta-alanine ligase [Oceanirhabdus sp. W0125-5]|uniref:pantoate--beta-alanine ligase n=1 Tax=Oceanirhabdus sp. W0125-5 TaxID=2999116 RepID=UPI0022F2B882|nr:pantoate--beta-alanine ligase [Oceanirhabdus sp. W0125-5]WBW99720.1 pantoate--beta-alanine ligase [Oceanirhabdus sp. W0125-5]
MESFSSIKDIKNKISQWKSEGYSIGFVPTMGYLHEGHTSLIQRAKKDNDKVIVSIFVNPTQFGPNEDLDNYPRDLERDTELCTANGGDVIFTPSAKEMYGDNPCAYVDIKELSQELCGASRPGHFRGVCTVVLKLFNIITPDRAYFGEKDAQQLAIIKKMVLDLNLPVEIIGCPIVREADGLAKSSRNTYLSNEQRKAAVVLSQSLALAKTSLENGERDANKIISIINEKISSEPLAKVDYIQVVDLKSLKTVNSITDDILVAIAVHFDKTRLIDNFSFQIKK